MNKLPISLSVFILSFFCSSYARGSNLEVCRALLHPIDNQVASVKAQGGAWETFEKRSNYRDYSTTALQLDQKAIALVYTLDYVCNALDRIPRNDVSNYILPLWRKKGEEEFINYQINGYGYALEEVMTWVEYAKYFEKHYKRKLNFAKVQETMNKSLTLVNRFVNIVRKVRKTNKVKEVVKETNELIGGFTSLHNEDPILKLADSENAAIPHASTLTESSDEM